MLFQFDLEKNSSPPGGAGFSRPDVPDFAWVLELKWSLGGECTGFLLKKVGFFKQFHESHLLIKGVSCGKHFVT